MHPSEHLKFCPFCGSSDFSFDGGRKFQCESCGRTQYINSAAAVAVIIKNKKGEILLTRRALNPAKGKLDLPGGFVDPLETVEQTVKREIKEELNIDVDKLSYAGSFPNEYVFDGMITYTADLAFVATVKNLSKLSPADDVAAVEFYAPDQIPMEEVAFTSIKNILAGITNSI